MHDAKAFASVNNACQWVVSFVNWYNHQRRHSGIKFVTPNQRYNGEAADICRQLSVV
uniref:integrase core domain-containing protein n=1 Tax=Cyanobium sp. TaxID=2164130 RepID=UPI004048B496